MYTRYLFCYSVLNNHQWWVNSKDWWCASDIHHCFFKKPGLNSADVILTLKQCWRWSRGVWGAAVSWSWLYRGNRRMVTSQMKISKRRKGPNCCSPFARWAQVPRDAPIPVFNTSQHPHPLGYFKGWSITLSVSGTIVFMRDHMGSTAYPECIAADLLK